MPPASMLPEKHPWRTLPIQILVRLLSAKILHNFQLCKELAVKVVRMLVSSIL